MHYKNEDVERDKMRRERESGPLKPPLSARAFVATNLASVRHFVEYQWQSWHANVLAENRGHVKRGHWRRSGSEGCVLPCSRVIAAAARPPRPCSLACTHADRNSTSSVHRHHHRRRRRCSVRASRLPRMPVWSEEQAKNAPRSLHVVDFTYHLEDTRKNKVSASSS